MRYTDKQVAEALEVLGFRYLAKDEDGTIQAFAEWPLWDEEEGVFYAGCFPFILNSNQFKALPRGYSRPVAAIDYNEDGMMYEF